MGGEKTKKAALIRSGIGGEVIYTNLFLYGI